MRKTLNRIFCMVLSLTIVFTTFAVLTVSAAGDTEVWQISAAMTKDKPVQAMNGITVTAMENLKYAAGKTTVGGITFNGNLQNTSGTNGKVTETEVSGPVLKFETTRSGSLSVAAKITASASKGIKVVNVKDVNKAIYYQETSVGTDLFTFDIEAGEAYYVWGTGTKPTFYGATFEEKRSVSAKAGDVVTIKATANSNALLGNVRLGDSSIALTKNSGMTESTFTMPEKNIDVYVDFVSNAVVDEVNSFSFDLIKGTNVSEDKVYDDLTLFDNIKTSIGDPDVSWTSSNEDVISISGEVNPQSVDTHVDITGVFSYQDYPNIFLYKTYSLTVPADTDDAGAVADAKASLTLGDTSSVKKNLELPSKGRRGTSIVWGSTNPAVVSTDGTVNPANGVDNTVKLTATISRGTVSDTKEFTIFVPGIIPIEINRAAVSNANGDVVMIPADGDYLSHIVYTDSINNKTGKEAIVATVYNSDRSEVLSEKAFNIKEYSEKPECANGDQTIIYIDKDALSVKTDSIIEIKAYEDIDSKTVELSKPYTYSAAVSSNPTIYVAGDSTACTYQATGSKNNVFPKTGWAAVLQNYFGSGATVNDLAISGRSSLSFLNESNYRTIKNNIKNGDYFIIQFGHNDSKSDDASRYTNPKGDRFTAGSYKKNIYDNYIQLALDKGAQPIITTSISRRSLSDSGLEAYVNAAKELGKELGLPVVDLYSKVNGYINDVGAEQAKDIYNYVNPKDSRFTNLTEGEFSKSQYYSSGTTDNTHINIYGAKMISQWFCDELVRIQHPLISKRSSVTMSLSDIPSYAAAAALTDTVSAAADGDTYKITVNYDSNLGNVEIISSQDTADKFVINSASFNNNGKLVVDYKSNGTADNAKLIVATYSDITKSVLTDAAVFDLKAEGVDEFNYTKPNSGTVQLFVWNGLESISPLVDIYSVE